MAKVAALVANRQVPQAIIAWVAARAMHPPAAPQSYNPHLDESACLLLRTQCAWGRCLRVCRLGTVRKAVQEGVDCLRCPAHDEQCSTHSVWVQRFTAQMDWYEGMFIWDWYEVAAGASPMHIDATIGIGDLGGGACSTVRDRRGIPHQVT